MLTDLVQPRKLNTHPTQENIEKYLNDRVKILKMLRNLHITYPWK